MPEKKSLRISGKNLDIGEALREHTVEKATEALIRYFEDRWSGHITLSKEGFGFRAEAVIHIDSGVVLHCEGITDDAYTCVDLCLAKLEKRLRRYKKKIRDDHGQRHHKNGHIPAQTYVMTAPEEDSEEEVVDFNPVVVAETSTDLRELTVSDAVMHLDFTGAPVIMFKNAGNGQVNVVYRRGDGHVGWIDPQQHA